MCPSNETPAEVVAFLEDEEPQERPAWRVETEADAIWATDKIATARQRRDRIVEQCQAMIAAAKRDAERAEAFFLPLLEAYYDRHPPARGKTIPLPTGSLRRYVVKGGPRVIDEAVVLAWARAALPAAVRVVESVDKAAIKDHIATTGELPPGVDIQPDEERFTVK